MTFDTRQNPQVNPRLAPESVMLSPTDFAAITRELEALRNTHRADVAERLRDARSYGTAVGDDDHLAILEDAAVDRGKIAQLERLVASATIVDDTLGDDGLAGLGSFVRVRDPAGKHVEYEIVGWRSIEALQTQVTPASPIGKALLGARGGDVVRVLLPSGRERTLEVVAVRSAQAERARAA
jgi:transcription elongation factor GreA